MDRLARNLDDLRRIVQELTAKGVRVDFDHEHLSFTGQDAPMANLLLSVMGAFAEFERALIRERQLEGIELAKRRGVYRGRHRSLDTDAQAQLFHRALAGESKSRLAVEYGISRQSLYRYLRAAEDRQQLSVSGRTGTESPDTLPVVGHRPSSGAMDPDDLL
jgi:DNA invertase Pin-like site-specific DNA recombinase